MSGFLLQCIVGCIFYSVGLIIPRESPCICENIKKYKFLKEFHIYSTRSNNLTITAHRLARCQTSSNHYAIRFYNTLPVEFRDLQNKQYRTLLKNYLISKAYYTLQEFFEDSFLELKQLQPKALYFRVKNGLLPRIRTFREITFFMLCVTRIFKSYFECLRLVTLN
jgi:hypothetical protein